MSTARARRPHRSTRPARWAPRTHAGNVSAAARLGEEGRPGATVAVELRDYEPFARKVLHALLGMTAP